MEAVSLTWSLVCIYPYFLLVEFRFEGFGDCFSRGLSEKGPEYATKCSKWWWRSALSHRGSGEHTGMGQISGVLQLISGRQAPVIARRGV